MIYENEIIMFTLGIGIYVFALCNKARFKRIPQSRLLWLAYCLLLPAWALTILEGFYLPNLANFFEHLLYAASAVCLAIWCWKISLGNREEVR